MTILSNHDMDSFKLFMLNRNPPGFYGFIEYKKKRRVTLKASSKTISLDCSLSAIEKTFHNIKYYS